jgi:hypothetical protein
MCLSTNTIAQGATRLLKGSSISNRKRCPALSAVSKQSEKFLHLPQPDSAVLHRAIRALAEELNQSA